MSNTTNVNTTTQNQFAQFPAPEAHQRAVFHAQPYSLDAEGFYFNDMEDYQTKYDANHDCFGLPVEEYEIQFIDGETADAQLFSAAGIDQATLERFFDEVEPLDNHEKAALYFLLQQGYKLDDAIDKIDEVTIQEGCAKDAAEQLFDEIYLDQIPEALQCYIDYDAFTRDCECSGEFVEFNFDGTTYTCTNANF